MTKRTRYAPGELGELGQAVLEHCKARPRSNNELAKLTGRSLSHVATTTCNMVKRSQLKSIVPGVRPAFYATPDYQPTDADMARVANGMPPEHEADVGDASGRLFRRPTLGRDLAEAWGQRVPPVNSTMEIPA